MASTTEIQSLAQALRGAAFFSAVHVSAALLILVYFDHIYVIGKFVSWPLTLYLLCGILLHYVFVLKKQKHAHKTKSVKVRSVFKAVTMIILSIAVFYVIAVLFGAPFYSAQEETFMFSVLLTILVVLPLIINLGLDTTISILSSASVFVEKDGLSTIFSIVIRFVLFGAWLGAVVIPLDWDRPWQAWPIPCSYGAMIGYVISQVFILSLNLPKIAQALNQILVGKRRKYEL